ncbi:V-set and immunoglobulin domain-containing protein 1 [Eublepharis macularius]|uniref:V-set and immunoglobulin domain-containing protein 1 n=1 Tax=Eublepharis macularius TaxID=481883 RepID=UPI0024103FF4|nr:V-set and immunoglobulin domain-containing protein 1 [Eublepharis macularius]
MFRGCTLDRFLCRPTDTLATMLKIFAILAALAGPLSCVVVTVPEKTVNTTVGGNITLLCTYRTEMIATNLLIQWIFYSAQERKKDTIYFSQSGQSYSYGEFKGRIQAANNTGNASITIFNMQASDTGIYSCDVFNPVDTNAQNEKSVAVSVLVPPSQPHCGLRGTPEMDHLVSLFCFSEGGMPVPTYQWQKVSGDTVTPVTESYNPKTGLFVIGNLTKFEEGYYRCMATNRLGNSSCDISVTTSHSEGGIIAGALIGAILAAALICGVVWFLASKEKKKKRKEKAAVNEMQAVDQKEPLNAEYTAVPSQENVPVAAIPPSKESTETNEYVTPEEIEVAAVPENEMQEAEHQPVA